jgi:hypothetical protein
MNASLFASYLTALDCCADVQGVLGDEYVIHPPNPDYGYECTPRNALTFGCMGADGVHYAILASNGVVTDESPVIQICPMDFSDLYQARGESFLTFLADGCNVSRAEMENVFATEQSGTPTLVEFLKERFDMSRLWDDARTKKLEPFLSYIEPKDSLPA